MRPLELIIPGQYYDSQIYSGYLYLWTRDGSILTIDWNPLIQSLEVESRLQLALRSAFQRSEYLYGDQFNVFLDNQEIRQVLASQFDDLSKSQIEISLDRLGHHSEKSD